MTKTVSIIINGIPYDYQLESISYLIDNGTLVQLTTVSDEDGDGVADQPIYNHPVYLIRQDAELSAADAETLIEQLGK